MDSGTLRGAWTTANLYVQARFRHARDNSVAGIIFAHLCTFSRPLHLALSGILNLWDCFSAWKRVIASPRVERSARAPRAVGARRYACVGRREKNCACHTPRAKSHRKYLASVPLRRLSGSVAKRISARRGRRALESYRRTCHSRARRQVSSHAKKFFYPVTCTSNLPS